VQLTVDLLPVPGRPDVLVVAPSGEVDLATAPELRRGLERAEAGDATALLIDLRGVGFIDSTGIGELVGCHRRCRENERRLAFVVPEGTTRKILSVTGMDAVFDLHHDEKSALESLRGGGNVPGSDG
jgi:anti-sigma B factor antagonist